MTLEKYFGHICKSGSQFAPVNWLAHELWLFFSPGAETSAAGKCHERGLAQALQHMAFAITTYPELRWHWVGSFHQLLLNFVFLKSWLLSVFSFNKFLQYLITDSLCYCWRNSCIYISTCCRHNPPIREAVGSYVFSILVELQHNCISGISVGSTQALKSFGVPKYSWQSAKDQLEAFSLASWRHLDTPCNAFCPHAQSGFRVIPLRILSFY